MASGVPVIAPSIGFLPNLVSDGIDGRIVELCSQAFSSVLSELSGNRTLLDKLATNARKTAEQRFDPSLQAGKAIALYEQILRAS